MKKPVQSYETAIEELENILEKLSSDTVTLEESVELYARAAEQISFCDKTLKDASFRIETITEALKNAREDLPEDDNGLSQ